MTESKQMTRRMLSLFALASAACRTKPAFPPGLFPETIADVWRRTSVGDITVSDAPDPGEAVVQGRLLVGGQRSRRLRPAEGTHSAPLWWPQGKVAGEYLPPWLAAHGFAPSAPAAPPEGEGLAIRRSVRAMAGAEAQYLFDLRRRYRISDPAIGSLGRQMRAMESR